MKLHYPFAPGWVVNQRIIAIRRRRKRLLGTIGLVAVCAATAALVVAGWLS